MDVDVVVARGGVHHRHRGDILQRVLQTLPTPRDQQVDHAFLGGEFGQLIAAAAGREHNRVGRQSGLRKALPHDFRQRRIRALGVAGAAQQYRVAALDGQHGAIDRDVGPGFIDDGHNTQRHPDLAEIESVVESSVLEHLPDRVVEGHHGPDPFSHGLDPGAVEAEPVGQGVAEPLCPFIGQILGVGGENRLGAVEQPGGDRFEREILVGRRCCREAA